MQSRLDALASSLWSQFGTIGATTLLTLLTGPALAAPPSFLDLHREANDALGLDISELVTLDLPAEPGRPVLTFVPLDGLIHVLDLQPATVRSPHYQVLVQGDDGSLDRVEPAPVRTLRGEVLGMPGSAVAGSVEEDGLHLKILLPGGDAFFVEPIGRRIAGAAAGDHVVYHEQDIAEHGGTCAAGEPLRVADPGAGAAPAGEGGVAGTGLCVTQLACDADYEYYLDYGSNVTSVQNRINSVINTMNLQYESEVGITHTITSIIVRTSSNDPYSSTDASTLLNQFRNYWNANHGSITRDVAHLFTGKEIDGGTIGIAWLNAICSSYAYGVVQSDFNNNFGCATDLSAHELGHNWGADHCSCTSNTMNPYITCANTFHPTFSIPEIIAFRDSRTCIDCNAPPTTGACCVESSCSIQTEADCVALGGSWEGANTTCTDSDGDGTPDCADGCPDDPNKIASGLCGCGVPDVDTDGDGLADCIDGCPNDPDKSAPGACGCGVPDTDSDGDGVPDCNDLCPGEDDSLDSDGDGTPDCFDGCPDDPNKTAPGDCGCGVADIDSDGDGTLDCNDGCPNDPDKIAPGDCGCGVPDDTDGNGIPDCTDFGACCVGSTCTVELLTDCNAMGGVWQGSGTDCAGDACVGEFDHLATADFATPLGSIAAGSYLDTHVSDNVYEQLQEQHSGGRPSNRVSYLEHLWTFNVAAGSSYGFSVEAHHDVNGEGDDFEFSYSMNNADWTPMLTVAKVSDDDTAQTYAFTEDIAGTVYVRVVDTEPDTPGNSSRESLYVDSMRITSVSGGGDLTPPSAPAGLTATGNDGSVTLDWADNGEGDLAGYTVYRSTTDNGGYAAIAPGLTASDYLDGSVTNGTTYYYVVTAADLAGNESADSDQATATPQAPGAPGMHVASIVVTTVNVGQGNKIGRAAVTIVNEIGAPVQDATVFGTFSGPPDGSPFGTTDANGSVVLETTQTAKGGVNVTFCVDLVTHPSLVYIADDDVETCDSN